MKPGMHIFRTFFFGHMYQMMVYIKLERKFISTDKQIEGTLQFLTAVSYMFFYCHSSLSFAVKFPFSYSLLVQHTVLSGDQNSVFLTFCLCEHHWMVYVENRGLYMTVLPFNVFGQGIHTYCHSRAHKKLCTTRSYRLFI